MSMDSQGSGSQGSVSGSNALGHGGSYSSKTGASMKSFIGEGLAPCEQSGRPKLAEVAKALLAAQAAGELPQASKKDLELQETMRKQKAEALALAQQAAMANGNIPTSRRKPTLQSQQSQNGQSLQLVEADQDRYRPDQLQQYPQPT